MSSPGAQLPGNARIIDRGYRPYEGPRRGARGAVRSLIRHSVQRVLGLKRSAWTKVLPFGTVFIAYVPAIVFVGITVLVPEVVQQTPDLLPTYGGYYFFVSAAIIVFTAFVAPELLCTDRRNGMLGLYLASPLTRGTYLLAKAAAVAGVLAIVTIGPPLFMLIARTVAGSGPEGPGDVAVLALRIVASGALLGLLYASLSLAISSTTTRKAAASAAIILVVLGGAAISDVLVSGARAADGFFLLNLLNMPFELVLRIYGEPSIQGPASLLSTPMLVVGYLAWVVPAAAFVWFRYQRIQVTR